MPLVPAPCTYLNGTLSAVASKLLQIRSDVVPGCLDEEDSRCFDIPLRARLCGCPNGLGSACSLALNTAQVAASSLEAIGRPEVSVSNMAGRFANV